MTTIIGKYYNKTNICDECKINELRYKNAHRERDNRGIWTGRWLCNSCRTRYYKYGTFSKYPKINSNLKCEIKVIDESEMKGFYERICSKCGIIKTSQWYIDPDNGKGLCMNCYRSLPGSTYDKIKLKTKCRNKELTLDDTMGLGFLGEMIVTNTLGLRNCNLEMDKFNFKFDVSPNSPDGRIEVKTAEISYIGDRYTFSKIETKNFDTGYFVCMTKNLTDVDRMYKIKSKYISTYSIGIYKNPTDSHGNPIVPWYEKYRIDEKPFNDTYHNMDVNNCSILKSRSGEGMTKAW